MTPVLTSRELLTARERVSGAIRWQPIDRIPVNAQISGGSAHFIGRQVNKDFYLDGEVLAAAHLAAWDELRDDFVEVISSGHIIEALGVNQIWPDDDYPMFNEPIVLTHKDADRLRVPDPGEDPFLAANVKAIQIIKKKVGDQAVVSSFVNGIFNIAGLVLGTENLMTLLATDPELVHKVLRVINRAQVLYAEALVHAGAELIMMPDATSSPACISPESFRVFALPYLTAVVQAVKSAGAFALYHPCGGEYPILDQVGQTGADVLWFSELVDLAVAQKIFVNRIAVSGTVDPSGVLFLGTPEGVTEHVKGILDSLPQKTGAIIQPGCGLSPNIPVENIKAMVDAVKAYGGDPPQDRQN